MLRRDAGRRFYGQPHRRQPPFMEGRLQQPTARQRPIRAVLEQVRFIIKKAE